MPCGTCCLSRFVCVLSLNRPGSGTLGHGDSKPQALARRPASPRLALCSRPAREPAVRSPPATTGPTLEASAPAAAAAAAPAPSPIVQHPASPFPLPHVARRCTRSSKRRWWPCWFHPEGCSREAAWPPAPAMAGSGDIKNIPNTSVPSCLPGATERASAPVLCAFLSLLELEYQTAPNGERPKVQQVCPDRPPEGRTSGTPVSAGRVDGRPRPNVKHSPSRPFPLPLGPQFARLVSSEVQCSISLSPPGPLPAALRSNRAHPPSPATGQISARGSIKPAHITCRTSITLHATAP